MWPTLLHLKCHNSLPATYVHHYTHTSSLLLNNLVKASIVGNVIKLIVGRMYFSSNVHKSGSHQNWFPRYNLVFCYHLSWLLNLSPGWDMKGAIWHGQWMCTLGYNGTSLKYSPHYNIMEENSLNIFYSTKIKYKFCLLNIFDYKLANCQTDEFKNQCWIENVVEMACCREEDKKITNNVSPSCEYHIFHYRALFILSDLFSHHSQTITTASTRSALFSYWRTL